MSYFITIKTIQNTDNPCATSAPKDDTVYYTYKEIALTRRTERCNTKIDVYQIDETSALDSQIKDEKQF